MFGSQTLVRRRLLIASAGLVLVLAVVAAPALSERPWIPRAVDFELVPPQASALAAKRGFVAPPLRVPKRFDVVGFRWSGSGEPAIAIRTRRHGGRWSRWTTVGTHAEHAPDAQGGEDGRGGGTSDPVWAGGADWVQYRMSEPVRGLRLHFVNTTGTATAADRAKTALRRAANTAVVALAGIFSARAQDAQPVLVPRAAWGADESCLPRSGPSYGEVRAAFVHHTVSTNTYTPEEAPSVVLGICRYHRNSNGWNDIGYNLLVDRYGAIYEGRAGGIDQAVVGAQAQGFNAQTTGIANIGTHTDVPQSEAAIDAMARLIRWKLPIHGQPTAGTVTLTSAGGSANRYPRGAEVEFERVSGHRDAGKTACPGDALYAQLPDLRARVGGVQPRASRTRLQATITPRVVRFPATVRAAGRLGLSSGEPVGDAPIQVQILGNRGWRTILETRTRADGSFEADVTPASRAALRVHYPGGASLRPSASARATVKVRPQITATRSVSRARVGQTPIVAGRIRPARSRVEVVVQRREGSRNVRVATFQVRARGGRFRKGVRVKTSGLYRFYVRFRGDQQNLSATSVPFYVRVVPTGGGAGAG